MTIRTIKTVAMTALLVAAMAMPAQSQSQTDAQRAREVRALLEQRDRDIKSLLGDKKTVPAEEREELKAMVNGIIDFESMAQSALGPHWNELNATQQHEFVEVFSEIVRAQSLSDLDVYRSKVAYDRVDVSGTQAHVATSVTFDEVPTRVDYVLSLKDGEWRVNDIVLDEVSTAEGYARSFQPVVKRRGFDTLMASLRKKLEKVMASGS